MLVGVMVAGCDIVRVGMGWGGALLDVGCSGAIAWSNFPFSKENSDSEYTVPIDRNKKRERVGNKLYIEGCRFHTIMGSHTDMVMPVRVL